MVQAVKDGSGFFGELGSECLEGGVGVTIEASVGCRRVEALRVLEPRGRPRHRHNCLPMDCAQIDGYLIIGNYCSWEMLKKFRGTNVLGVGVDACLLVFVLDLTLSPR